VLGCIPVYIDTIAAGLPTLNKSLRTSPDGSAFAGVYPYAPAQSRVHQIRSRLLKYLARGCGFSCFVGHGTAFPVLLRSSHSLHLVHQRIQEERQEARRGSVTDCGANGRAFQGCVRFKSLEDLDLDVRFAGRELYGGRPRAVASWSREAGAAVLVKTGRPHRCARVRGGAHGQLPGGEGAPRQRKEGRQEVRGEEGETKEVILATVFWFLLG
jgi:hypothetical protein